MAKNKKIEFKHNELVKFISESIMELYAKRLINEQNTYIKIIPFDRPGRAYGGTVQQAWDGWNGFAPEVREELTHYGLTPFDIIPHKEYDKLPSEIRSFLQGYLYPFTPPTEIVRNNAIAVGQSVYQFIPGIKTMYINEVKICFNLKLDKKVNCETGLAHDGTHEEVGHDVTPNSVVVPSIFAYEGGMMNTKYFCRPYLLGDKKIPEDVKPKVLGFLQKAWSKQTGEDLGVNKDDWYSGEKQTNSELGGKLSDTMDWDILKLVSTYVKKETESQRSKYNAGKWRYIVGSIKNKESAVPLSHEQHLLYFENMFDFAEKLLDTNCGFGVGKESMTNAEKALREKYGNIFAFQKEKPDNWDEMSEQEQLDWLAENESKLEKKTTIEQQDEAQFWWDMASIVLVVAGLVVGIACPPCAAVAAGLVFASVGMGVASGIFDIYQGQTGWGVLGISLELLPFAKIIKVSKYIKLAKISDAKLGKMLGYALENGKDALKTTFTKGGHGKALFKALENNKSEILKLLDANTKKSIKFLKRFSTMDPSEFYLLRKLSPSFAKATKEIPWSQFSKGMDEMASIIFANRTAWRTMLGKIKYAVGVPMKMVLYNLTAMAAVNTYGCFDAVVKTPDWTKMKSQLMLGDVGGAIGTVLSGIEIKLDPEQVSDNVGCTLIALLSKNLSGKSDAQLQEKQKIINELFVEGDVELTKDGQGNTVISITNITEDGSVEEVTVADIDEICNSVVSLMGEIELAEYKAMVGSYLNDEEILEWAIFELGSDNTYSDAHMKEGEVELERLMKGVNAGNEEDIEVMIDLLEDAWKVFALTDSQKENEIKVRYDKLLTKYQNE